MVHASDCRRKHVTTACVACRESKIKCDGAIPACSNCTNKAKECHYHVSDDKRKLTFRFAIDLLVQRNTELCAFITSNKLQIPPMAQRDETALRKALDHLRINTNFNNDESAVKTTNRSTAQLPSLAQGSEPVRQSVSDHVGDPELDQQPIPLSMFPGEWDKYGDNISDSVDDIVGLSQIGNVDFVNSNASMSGTRPSAKWPTMNPTNSPSAARLPQDDTLQQLFPQDQLSGATGVYSQPFSQTSPQSRSSVGVVNDDDEETETLVDQLSERIGSLQIGPGGQIQYFGPTSNFNLIEMPAADNLTVHRTVRNNGQEHLNRLELGKPVPEVLEAHLTNLYFSWQNPTFYIVQRTAFETAKTSWRVDEEDTPYFSEGLQNAICALGAAFESRHHPSFITFPQSLADFFADRAKALIEIELDCPTLATVQAMVVLSSHDIGCKRDSRGWLYSGMAVRLAFDLGLHIDVSQHVARGSLTQAHADFRRDVFWGALSVDQTWGFLLGSPSRVNMEDVSVSRPNSSGHPGDAEPSEWIPYISSQGDYEPLIDTVSQIHAQRVALVEIMAPLGSALYGSLRTPADTLQQCHDKTAQDLVEWKAGLPADLQVDPEDRVTPYLPHVILLHMQYHQNLIHANRPWMSGTHYASDHRQDPAVARSTCIQAAHDIARLISLYESRYSLRHMTILAVGITCSAALLLIFASAINQHQPISGGEDTAAHLSTCFRALDELGAGWESAKRAREFLTLLQRRWKKGGRVGSRGIRRPSQNTAEFVASKRSRMDGLGQDAFPKIGQIIGDPELRDRWGGARLVDTQMSLDQDWIFANPGDNYL